MIFCLKYLILFWIVSTYFPKLGNYLNRYFEILSPLKINFLKVSEFQNEFMKISFLPKYERKNSAPVLWRKAEILTIFLSYFGRNNNFINSFWNLLTFSTTNFVHLTLKLDNPNCHIHRESFETTSIRCSPFQYRYFSVRKM